jgi:hypothetical protein
MPDDASATREPAALAERVRFALESGNLNAIRDLLDSGARWGAPEGPVTPAAATATRSSRGGPGRAPPVHERWSRR